MSNEVMVVALPKSLSLDRLFEGLNIDPTFMSQSPSMTTMGPMKIRVDQHKGRGMTLDPYPSDVYSSFLWLSAGRLWNDVRMQIALNIYFGEFNSDNKAEYLCWLNDSMTLFYAKGNKLFLNEKRRDYISEPKIYGSFEWVNLPEVGSGGVLPDKVK